MWFLHHNLAKYLLEFFWISNVLESYYLMSKKPALKYFGFDPFSYFTVETLHLPT
uniref:Uncharacterized protein n=1 Tax=Arundo donax TaxID=35708 RepID=A0A0A9DJH5_ARUDO